MFTEPRNGSADCLFESPQANGLNIRTTDDLVANGILFVTTLPYRQLAGVIDEVDRRRANLYRSQDLAGQGGRGLRRDSVVE